MSTLLQLQPVPQPGAAGTGTPKREGAIPLFPISPMPGEGSWKKPIHVHRLKLSHRTEPVFDVHYPVDIGIVLSGKVRRFFPDQTAEYSRGQIWFTGIWERQGWQVIQPPCEFLTLTISPDFLSGFRFEEEPALHLLSPFLVPSAQRPGVPSSERGEILSLARRFRLLQDQPGPTRNTLYKILLLELLARVLLPWQSQPSAGTERAEGVSQINPAMKLIFTQHRYIRVEEAASACGLSIHHFNRLFQQMSHQTFAKFALHYRLSGVMATLLKTGHPLKSVSYEWGFKHLSQLDRCFRRYFGCSPRQYVVRHTRQLPLTPRAKGRRSHSEP